MVFRGWVGTKSSKDSLVVEKQQHDPREHVAKSIQTYLLASGLPWSGGPVTRQLLGLPDCLQDCQIDSCQTDLQVFCNIQKRSGSSRIS